MSVGGFTLVSVISPGVTTRASSRCGDVPPAREALADGEGAQVELDGRGLDGRGLDGRGLDGRGLNGRGLDGRGLNGRGLDGRGLNGRGLDGRGLNGRGLDRSGLGLVGVAGRAELAEVELSRLEFAVVDLETTGWSPEVAAITEIGAVRVRGGLRQGEFASLVNPGMPVPPGIEELTGITDLMLTAAPRLAAVLPGLLDFAQGCVLVAHNAPFDLGFLVAACGDCGLAWPGFIVLDTVMLARRVMDPDEVPDCKLGTLAGFFRARTAPNHRALADARATADVLGWLIRRLAHRGIHTLNQLSAWADVVA
jgi:DNA polymerase III epsilon subunit family exonuclease